MQTNPSSSLEINQLEKVFATFNQVSADLGSRYQQLEIQVAGLSDELAASHSARIQELTEKELLAAKLTALMSALPGGIITLDADSIIKEENAIAIELLGHSLKSSHWSEVFENTSPNTPTLHGEISVKSTNKRISISSSPYGDDDLKDTNTIILLTDITENYRLNNQLIREERLAELGEMAAKLAHQIRTPLSSAILYLSHLTPSSISRKILDRLKKIENLTNDMLSYIRGDTEIFQEVSLKKLLNEVKETNILQIKSAGGDIHLQCPQEQCLIQGNQEALFNALTNIVENAIQAIKQKPLISLRLSKAGEMFLIEIEDNGPGIDDSIKELIFNPFFSTRAMGTGLGLAVVASAVTEHKGNIQVIPAAQGGTIFRLFIPSAPSCINNTLADDFFIKQEPLRI